MIEWKQKLEKEEKSTPRTEIKKGCVDVWGFGLLGLGISK